MSLNSRLVDVPPYGSPEWVANRNRGLGASELATVAGVNPWGSEFELAMLKRGETEPFTGNAATRFGHRMEALILDAYEEETGTTLVRGETWTDARWPHLFCTLDGRHDRIGVEAKAGARPWDELPPYVRIQAYAQMGIADLERVDVVRATAYAEPVITPVERDEALIADLLGAAEEWWRRYVIDGERPPIDASRAAGRYLARLDVPSEMEADATQAALVAQWLDAKRRLETAEHDQSLVANRIKDSMAGSYALTGPGFRVSWKPQKAREKKDWEAIAIALAMHAHIDPVVINETVTAHTETGEGARPFRVTVEEETTP